MSEQELPDESIEKGRWSEVRARDRDLVASCLDNDEAAWTEVWLRYGPMIKAVARRAGCDDEEVRDVLQRVALVTLQGLQRLSNPAKLGGWLATTARFQALDLIRQRRPTLELFETTAVVTPQHDEDLARAQTLSHVHQALLAIDERCQRLIRRLDLKDPPDTYAQVAVDEGLAATSLGPIRRRCLNRLKKKLDRLSR